MCRPGHFSALCTRFDDGSSSSSVEAEPPNIWNPLLAALVHHGVGEVLQRALSHEDLGKAARTCHFACDSLCDEMYVM